MSRHPELLPWVIAQYQRYRAEHNGNHIDKNLFKNLVLDRYPYDHPGKLLPEKELREIVNR